MSLQGQIKISSAELIRGAGPVRIPKAAKRKNMLIKIYTILLIKTHKILENTHMLYSS